ncbi:hypothetical protein EVAR_53567_1 [Eumeta japonica]|uniref:Uncharacterized protein n=1 Tax=Eumeta variegata TaxID=151549 RepID=A0A4C1YH83_EUMVA|nr:hypothetical protein EVAR_53567_1 [Eumeta japonica]
MSARSIRVDQQMVPTHFPRVELVHPWSSRDAQSSIPYILLERRARISRHPSKSTKGTPNRRDQRRPPHPKLSMQLVHRITNRVREPLDLVLVTANTTSIDNTTKREFFNITSTALRRAPARAVTASLSYAKATVGFCKDPPTNSAPNKTSIEDVEALVSMISIVDIGETASLAKKFKAAADPVEKILLFAGHASLVEAIKNNKI